MCWECRSVRSGKAVGHWPAVVRYQLPDCSMTDLDGRPVAHDWRVNPFTTISA